MVQSRKSKKQDSSLFLGLPGDWIYLIFMLVTTASSCGDQLVAQKLSMEHPQPLGDHFHSQMCLQTNIIILRQISEGFRMMLQLIQVSLH